MSKQLGGLFGGGETQRVTKQSSDISSEFRPMRKEILDSAMDLFRGGAPDYFSTYVAPSGQTMGALSGMEQAAAGFSPFLSTAQNTIMQNLTGTNPLFEQATKSIVEKQLDPYRTGNRYGGGYAQKAVAEGIAPTLYTAQQGALSSLPQMYAMSMLPSETMMKVGAAREEIDRQGLEEQAQEAMYPYLSQLGLLGDISGLFTSMPLGTEGQTVTPVSKPSPFGQLAGMAMQGAGILGGAGTGSILGQLLMGGMGGGMGGTGGGFAKGATYSPYNYGLL